MRGSREISMGKAKQYADLADTSLTLTGRYNPKPRETPDRRIWLDQAKCATNGNLLKPLGKDS